MKTSIPSVIAALMLAANIASAETLFNGQYQALQPKETLRLTPEFHRCLSHCATRTVQETRIRCSVGGPAHIGGWENAWQLHEETWLVEEDIVVNSDCSQKVAERHEIQLDEPQYWPEDDIWNPMSYYDSGLSEFNCGDLAYNSTTNLTDTFVYRITVNYQFRQCK